ncbi:MAG: fumarylacetoacetate hydrolase family protein [Dethiobacteria bacterium]|jgi:2-keto-4-pentenoate hydratase/2-oxohepta-3-ene-1,7-dioic acid hydratase in catechol pathway|nr:fumarylacetoacetate hydrolase family protein [Bacillota bacterium]
MKIVRFLAGNKASYGLMEGGSIKEVEGKFASFIEQPPQTTGRSFSLEEVKLLAPCTPSKVICIGLNYKKHAEEMNLSLPETPVIFMKPSTSVLGPGKEILLPPQSRRVDYEAELGVVIGRPAYSVSREQALDYVLGYTCSNDVTARDLQSPDEQWTYSKGFDTFAPLGPVIETEIEDPNKLEIRGYLNGKIVQESNTEDMIFDAPYLIEYITACMTLLPGDVIITGTPSGVGPLSDGDTITIEIEGVGQLTNKVRRR